MNDSSVYDDSSYFTIEPGADKGSMTLQNITLPPSVTKDLKTYTGREEYSGYVGNDDYYKFYVDSPGYLQFALRGMSADADLQLLNSSGKVLESSRKSGNSDEYANENLGIGTYYMRVYGHNGADTNYRLVLNLDKAKNDRSNARWLGELAGQRKEYKDFIGTSSGDQYDYYKFTVQEPRFLEYALRDLTAPADIDILNSSGARITPKENDKDNHRYNLHETMGLQAGTYYARVTAPTDSSQQTNYKLVLNLKGEYNESRIIEAIDFIDPDAEKNGIKYYHRRNIDANPNTVETMCNWFAANVLERLKIDVPRHEGIFYPPKLGKRNKPHDANYLYRYFHQADKWENVNAEEAVNAVKSDTVVVASSPGNPGHIAIVRPDSEINNIFVAQAGWETGKKLSIDKAFGSDKFKLKYFKYLG